MDDSVRTLQSGRDGYTRRRVTGGLLGSALFALAGCLGEDTEEETNGDDEAFIDPELRLNGHVLSDTFPFNLVDPETGDVHAGVHVHGGDSSHWHYAPVEVPLDDLLVTHLEVIDSDRKEIPLGPDGAFEVGIQRKDPASEELFAVEVDENVLTWTGLSAGSGAVTLGLVDDGTTVWDTPPLTVEVSEEF